MTNNNANNLDEPENGAETNEEKLLHGIQEENNEELLPKITIPKEMTRCGIGWFHPQWLQIFSSKKVFVLVYAITGMMQFALGSYYVGTLTTLEKSFKMSSRMSGIITAAWDVGSLVANIIFTYIASKGHRTRWVAFGTFVAGLTCFMRVLPFWIFGPGSDVEMYTYEHSHSFNNKSSRFSDGNYTGIIDLLSTNDNCVKNESTNNEHAVSAYILLISQILLGVGTSLYWTCGAAYLDDNVRKNIVPFLLATVQTIRLFGPTIGFLLSSYALSIYVDPALHPFITNEDPRWIGAWWLGWYPIGILCFILAVLLSIFPRILPRAAMRRKSIRKEIKKKSLSDFWGSVKRVLKNKIVMFNSFSTVLFCMGSMAYWNFMPKYMETVFHLSASKSNFVTGTVGILSNALGVLIAGLVISKVKPSPRFLAGWNVFVEILDVAGHVAYTFLSCPEQNLHGHFDSTNSWNLTMDCNANYSCGTDIQYAPVCDSKNEIVFYSPCHAGCNATIISNSTKSYGDCACVENRGIVTDGPCPLDCGSDFVILITITGFLSFTSATGRSANTILSFRSVSEEDKSLSIGITEAFLCLFAFIPSPVFYGMLVDWTCLVWADDCGKPGNCWLYNGKMLRYIFNLSASGFYALGTLLDGFVWYYSKNLKIYDEDFEEKDENSLFRIEKNKQQNIMKLLDKNPVHINTISNDPIN